MSVEILSVREYADQLLSDIDSKTNQDTPPLSVSYNRAIANAVAALVLTGKLSIIDALKECFPQTASEEIGLPLWGELVNRPRIAGTPAELQATATGTNGVIIGENSAGPTWKADSGMIYSTKTGGLIQTGIKSIAVLATQSGIEGTLQIGDEIKLTSTIVGVDQKATITAINVTGAEAETIANWRAAIVQKTAFPAEIGTASWFYNETVSIAGITRAYPYADEDYPGRVLLYAVADGNTDGVPSLAQLAAIEAHFKTSQKNILWATDLLPNSAKRIEAFASTIEEYTLTVIEGVPALSANMKDSIDAAIENYALTRNPYIEGLSLLDQGTLEATAISSLVSNTIESNPSETGKFTGVTLEKGEVLSGFFVLPIGKRAKITVVYT